MSKYSVGPMRFLFVFKLLAIFSANSFTMSVEERKEGILQPVFSNSEENFSFLNVLLSAIQKSGDLSFNELLDNSLMRIDKSSHAFARASQGYGFKYDENKKFFVTDISKMHAVGGFIPAPYDIYSQIEAHRKALYLDIVVQLGEWMKAKLHKLPEQSKAVIKTSLAQILPKIDQLLRSVREGVEPSIVTKLGQAKNEIEELRHKIEFSFKNPLGNAGIKEVAHGLIADESFLTHTPFSEGARKTVDMFRELVFKVAFDEVDLDTLARQWEDISAANGLQSLGNVFPDKLRSKLQSIIYRAPGYDKAEKLLVEKLKECSKLEYSLESISRFVEAPEVATAIDEPIALLKAEYFLEDGPLGEEDRGKIAPSLEELYGRELPAADRDASLSPDMKIIRRTWDAYAAQYGAKKIVLFSGHTGSHARTFGTTQGKSYYMIDVNWEEVNPDAVLDVNNHRQMAYIPEQSVDQIIADDERFIPNEIIPIFFSMLKPGGKLIFGTNFGGLGWPQMDFSFGKKGGGIDFDESGRIAYAPFALVKKIHSPDTQEGKDFRAEALRLANLFFKEMGFAKVELVESNGAWHWVLSR